MSSVESTATRELIACECRQLVLSQGVAGAVATIGVSTLFLVTMRDVHSPERLMVWAGMVALISALRVVLAIWAKRSLPLSSTRLPNTPAICLLVGALAGGVWGIAATWLFPLGYSELYFVAAFLLIGMPAGAISSFGAWWPAYAAYVIASVGPFAVYFLLSGRSEFLLAGLAACLFGAFLLREGFVIGRTIQRNIAQRIALLDMTRSLGEALDRADEASRTKSTFLANMSHELRTPLNAIIGMSQLLADAPDAPAHRHLPDTIRRAGNALLALINDVLDTSQIEAGKIALRTALFSPRRLIDEVLDMFGPEAASKGLGLNVRCADSVPERFIGDQARLRQILVNLVGNAIKFTAAGGVQVEMSCISAGIDDGEKTLSIDVVDTGPGIPETDRERIFHAFQQVDASTSRLHPGTGLGLKITRDLVTLMNGTIDVVAEPECGSRFRLRIPQAAPRDIRESESENDRQETPVAAASFAVPPPRSRIDAPSTAQAQAASPIAAIDLRVLVVEDNILNSSLVKLMLERHGCTVECISNGVDALSAMLAGGWDIVLMDCQMPQMDGYATTRRWRETEALLGRPRLPIVALTAHAMADDRQKCLDAGMDDYLTKPVILDDLRAILIQRGQGANAAREASKT
jgi:signal transduction histidine kinase/ActR/RegA family two-component response regulator